METAAILALLQAVPSIFALATQAKATMSLTDQAAVDAALDVAKAAALGHIAKAVGDLTDAADDA